MKIVVLDGRAMGGGDELWAPLRALGEVTICDATSVEQIETRAKDAVAVLTVRVPMNREIIRKLTSLRYIGVLGSDSAFINIEAARKRGILVNSTTGADAESTAQHTIALLLELALGVGHHAHTVRNGRWSRNQDFTYRLQPLMELSGKTIGLIGCGAVGSRVARIAQGFGMTVLAYDPASQSEIPQGVRTSGLEELLSESDVLSLHCAHAPQTERLINAATLARVKPSAYLLNTAHGALIDEEAVADALRERKLAGYAADVLSSEPPSLKNPLLRAPRCIITPHLAWGTREARQRIIAQAAEQLRVFRETSARVPHDANT